MNTKGFTLVGLSILALVLVLGFASADIKFIPTSLSETVTEGTTDIVVNFQLNHTGPGGNYTSLVWSGNSSEGSWTTLPNDTDLTINETANYSATLTISSTFSGTINANINVNNSGSPSEDLPISITVTATPVTYEFCSGGAIDDDDLVLKVDIKNTGEGDDDEWIPLDVIEIELELENDKNNIDLDNVVFEIGLFEFGSDTNIIDDMFWLSEDDEEFEYGDIDENEDGAHTFEFKIDPDEVSSGDYVIMAKAYPDGDESDTCIDYSEDLAEDNFGSSTYYAVVDITKENDRDKMVIIDEDSIGILQAECGDQVAFTADVWNIGGRDFEDQTMITLYSAELGLDLQEVILGDLDEGDNAEVSFVFEVPRDATEKLHQLALRAYYEYDEDDGKYLVDYDRKSEDTFKAYLTVAGNCVTDIATTPTVSANLESEAKAGEDLLVKVMITNPSEVTATYMINAAGYAEWASSASLNQDSFTLGAGESEEVMFTFAVKSDAEGEQLFNIELLSEGQFVSSKPVSVYIEESGKGFINSENAAAYALGLLSIILIIVIIIVAVRVSRK